jgi:uncharacterized protein YaeQ
MIPDFAGARTGLAEVVNQRLHIASLPKGRFPDCVLRLVTIPAEANRPVIIRTLAHARTATQADVRNLNCRGCSAHTAFVTAHEIAVGGRSPAG